MGAATIQPQREQQHPDIAVKLGGWLFSRRTWLPVPLAILVLQMAVPAGPLLFGAGVGIVLAGEATRIWAVRHIGVISRTRSDRLGPLVSRGPFARVRNPLYLGNIALWTGFAVSAGRPALIPIIVGLLAIEYHAIVRWEETLLEGRLGERYRDYASRVPRWLPRPGSALSNTSEAASLPFSWRDTFFSERGTLVAIAVGYALLWVRTHLPS